LFVCAGNGEEFSFAKPIGVGLVNSAINLTKEILYTKPDFIVFVGSVGSYGDYKIFDIVESCSASNIELSFLQNYSYTPIDNVLKSSNKIFKDETIINSSNYISSNFELSKNFNKYGIGLENMEFFSVVSVAQKFDIDVAGIFIVTNYCNSDAHKDFLKNHKEAKERLSKYIKSRFQIGF
jgi:nucleoside phosphorylase